ncbi:MAG: hypothetical protein GOMPHAMPRED_000766 [Gomphillus americanus]|uniref:Sulfhydryl oxidase n=1 Tax=Gomphillus americanus TaxID=1940652 RepID=A0A8H3EZQ3_9LECA|nr:MAG: hypothetical protein GOMPHAMPRED_000766 [Gomphillus americanus]
MPSPGAMANRRLMVYIVGAIGILSIFFITFSRHGPTVSSNTPLAYAATPIHEVTVKKETLNGGAIMPKLGNETLKAELGRAAWKVLHTTMARFPDKPTEDESTALFSYIHLFARLYPCGECAGHFRKILEKFPPQVKSRSSAAVWACYVHNEVNFSLKKPKFDCDHIGDFYKCGCAGEEEEKGKTKEEEAAEKSPDLKIEREP